MRALRRERRNASLLFIQSGRRGLHTGAVWEEYVTERIRTLHPAGKQGVNIDKGKYDMVREAVEDTLRAEPGITFSEMTEEVGRRIGDVFDGSVGWYVVSVKLDLEARGVLERVDGRSPQRLRLVE